MDESDVLLGCRRPKDGSASEVGLTRRSGGSEPRSDHARIRARYCAGDFAGERGHPPARLEGGERRIDAGGAGVSATLRCLGRSAVATGRPRGRSLTALSATTPRRGGSVKPAGNCANESRSARGSDELHSLIKSLTPPRLEVGISGPLGAAQRDVAELLLFVQSSYSDSPAASRAFSRVSKTRHFTTMPSRNVQTWKRSRSTDSPLSPTPTFS